MQRVHIIIIGNLPRHNITSLRNKKKLFGIFRFICYRYNEIQDKSLSYGQVENLSFVRLEFIDMCFLYREGFNENNNTKIVTHRYFCADVKEATREVRGKGKNDKFMPKEVQTMSHRILSLYWIKFFFRWNLPKKSPEQHQTSTSTKEYLH